MREILFRGKHKNGFWCYGNLNINSQGVTIITPDETALGKHGAVIPETVGQYTGLTDRNGKKIFEGDIVRVHQFLFDGNEYENEITISIEYMSDCTCFGANIIYGRKIKHYMGYTGEKVVIPLCDLYGLHEESFEVIGNIHDNPELLESEDWTNERSKILS